MSINGIGRFGVRSYLAPTTSLSSIITNGLIMNLDAGNAASYPGTGTTWTDLSGNGNNTTLYNGTSYSSANGGTMVFDGINDYSSQQIIPFTTSFTIFMWVYPISGTGIMTYGESGRAIMALDYNTSGNLRIYTNNYYETFNSALTLNSWNLISVVARESSSTREVFVNGISKGVNSWSVVTQPAIFKLGVQSFSGYGNCRIAQALIYNRDLSSTEVLQNYNATKSRYGFTTRTAAFAAATGITDTTILNALNTFDTGLISNGLDTNLQSIHPFVGGTSTTHKFNFMNPSDTDAAFRLVFNGGWIHSSTGAKPNGTNAYADTKWNIATQMTNGIDSAAVGIYLRTDMIAAQQFLLTNSLSYFGLYTGGSTIYPSINDGNNISFTPTSKKGLFQTSRTNTTSIISSVKAEQFTRTQSTTSIGNTNVYLACQNNGGSPGSYATQEIAFSYLTNTKFTLAQQLTINTLVQALQTSLSRAV